MFFVGIDLHKKTISLCVVNQERQVLDEPGGRSVGISLRLGLKGYAAEGTAPNLVLAEMGQIDRRRRRRGCAQTSAVYFLHRGLDKPFSIDGGILFCGSCKGLTQLDRKDAES